ncbi:MAG: NAD kinase [Streptomycetaceae bacterium]|nr:MAG: NAD kinase [Streptomycetaceae bacterium]
MSLQRSVLLVVNSSRENAQIAAQELAKIFSDSNFLVLTNTESELSHTAMADPTSLRDCEIAIVLGGDGTMLRGAEAVRGMKIALLGVNLGHVGFLAEVEKPSMREIADAVINKTYLFDERMVLSYSVERSGKQVAQGWALNEVTIERESTTMVQLFVQIDRRPLSRWGCDGLICSTPTGSTAYAFSAGGPVVWPEVEALVLLPISAHALFSRPMVVSPQSEIVVDVESADASLLGDSLRKFALQQGDRVTIKKDSHTVLLAHLNESLFSDRLVAKFKLPVEGWRGE